MPAPWVAHVGVALRLAVGVALLGSPIDARASSEARRFDIAAQPLASALVEFADSTGMAALVDAEVAGGKRSTAVHGRLLPQDALRILLAGTGLSFRRAGATAFTVGPNTTAPMIDGEYSDGHRRAEFNHYFALIQGTIEQALCSDAEVRPGPYRSVVQVWVGQAGSIDAIHPVGSSGDDGRDARIALAIARARVTPPPVGLPQPVTVILQQSTSDAVCASGAAAAR